MVIDDLDVEGMTAIETKTQPPLIVDADAPPACPIALQRFEAVGKRLAQILGTRGEMQIFEPTQGDAVECRVATAVSFL